LRIPATRSSGICGPPGDGDQRDLPSFPTRRSSDLDDQRRARKSRQFLLAAIVRQRRIALRGEFRQHLADTMTRLAAIEDEAPRRSEEHTSELQSRENLVCRLLLEKKPDISDG